MKMMALGATLSVFLFALLPAAQASNDSPIGKVLQLLSDLQSNIIGEGKEVAKTFSAYSEWCEERSKNLGFDLKTGKAEARDLKATIEEEGAIIASLDSRVEKLARSIATDESDLKAATTVRAKEAEVFAAEEKELMEVVNTLERAIGILEKEMQQGGVSMVQLKGAGSVAQALSELVRASALTSADAKQLAAFVQSSQESEDDDASFGAPDAAAYEGQSGGIINTFGDLLEKAEGQLADARTKETSGRQHFELLKQSLTDAISDATKEMAKAKQGLAASSEKKAIAEGDLKVTSGDVKEDVTALADLQHACMAKARDFEAATKSRGEELKALAAAKAALSDTTAGAADRSYGPGGVALVQLSSGAGLADYRVVRFVRDLARKHRVPELAQLAARMASAVRSGMRGGADPFTKVKGLIAGMIERLEDEAQADASHKSYCDRELSASHEKEDDKAVEITKLSNKIDQMTSRSAQLKAEVAALQKALSELAKAQAEMDQLRQQEKADYTQGKADMERGLQGVKLALKLLREYYAKDTAKAHEAAEGAGGGIIGLLEVIESDFSQGLIEMTATENAAQATYDKETKENEIEKTTKEQDAKYKGMEATGLDEAVAEASSDRSGTQSELDAVLEYLKTLEKQCIARAETFGERKARFEAELAGLKEALEILEGEAALLQRGERHTVLRSVRPHA